MMGVKNSAGAIITTLKMLKFFYGYFCYWLESFKLGPATHFTLYTATETKTIQNFAL
jgi:hypothetical protein